MSSSKRYPKSRIGWYLLFVLSPLLRLLDMFPRLTRMLFFYVMFSCMFALGLDFSLEIITSPVWIRGGWFSSTLGFGVGIFIQCFLLSFLYGKDKSDV